MALNIMYSILMFIYMVVSKFYNNVSCTNTLTKELKAKAICNPEAAVAPEINAVKQE